MKKFNLIVILFALGGIMSCGTEEEPEPENQNPGSFQIQVSDVTETSATLSWSESVDPEGDNVTYEIIGVSGFSGNESLSQNGLTATYSDLSSETNYAGEITVSDGNGGMNMASFSFTTLAIPEPTNTAPGSFTVSVSGLSNATATLIWTAAEDAENDDVTYEVQLNSNTLMDNISGTELDITGLSGGIDYSGVIIASDEEGLTSETTFSFSTYVIDISLFAAGDGDCIGGVDCLKSIELVDCTFEEGGGSAQCYEITYYSNPINDDGPFCPETIEETGGLGNYDGDGIENSGSQDGDPVGLSRMNVNLFRAMEKDGYDIISQGKINIQTDVPGSGRISEFSAMAFCLAPSADDNLELTFQIPVYPEALNNSDDIESVEYVGLALDGIPINGAPPSVVANNGMIPSLDRCGVHHDPAGYLHWHFVGQNMNQVLEAEGLYEEGVFECDKIMQDTEALIGFARDGYPIYSIGGDTEENTPALDGCNGHEAKTAEYPEGIYHYHASTAVPNVPPCIVGKQSSLSFDKPR